MDVGSVGLLFVLSYFWFVQEIHAGGNSTYCGFVDMCNRQITIRGRTINVSGTCMQEEACETTWGPWGQWRTFRRGTFRRRYGNCVGTRCNKIMRETEESNNSVCDPSPCANGFCTVVLGVAVCDCRGTGFMGERCEIDINECNLGGCNTGTCINSPGSFTCNCTGTGFEGPTCNDRDGNWATWGEWTDTTSCTASCCGGTFSRERTRTCTSPRPSGDGDTCPGSGTETETDIPCNEQVCPLSCEGEDPGTIFNHPCLECSQTFYACSGEIEPVELECPSENVWSPSQNKCEPVCD